MPEADWIERRNFNLILSLIPPIPARRLSLSMHTDGGIREIRDVLFVFHIEHHTSAAPATDAAQRKNIAVQHSSGWACTGPMQT